MNGLSQSTGWPTVVTIMGNWFSRFGVFYFILELKFIELNILNNYAIYTLLRVLRVLEINPFKVMVED